MHQQLICAAIEKIIAKALSLNLSEMTQLTMLEGKALSVRLDEFSFPLIFNVVEHKVFVLSTTDPVEETIADCQINTSIKTLIELKNDQQLTELIKQDKLDITGDIKVAQHFAQIAENLNIDWQSELAKHIGDVATYKLGRLGQSIHQNVKHSAQQIEADIGEYLVHEKRLIVDQYELSDFSANVGEINAATNTLANRIDKLIEATQSSLSFQKG